MNVPQMCLGLEQENRGIMDPDLPQHGLEQGWPLAVLLNVYGEQLGSLHQSRNLTR